MIKVKIQVEKGKEKLRTKFITISKTKAPIHLVKEK
jgi:hypothetical protein